MTGFSAHWLHLREPSDRTARAAADAAMGEPGLAALRGSGPGTPGAPPWRVLDLGCGTGAALRHLAPRLGGPQRWNAWDHDEALLAAWPRLLADWAHGEGHVLQTADDRASELRVQGTGFAATVVRHRADLARNLPSLPYGDTDLLSASALLDLVSPAWLEELILRARQAHTRLSLALIVDGRLAWDPSLPGDDDIAAAFVTHQRRDKGFGPALGATAPEATRRLLTAAGYVVHEARSDWVLHGGALQAALIEGMAAAVLEQQPESGGAVMAWRTARLGALAGSTVQVGHVDFAAAPRG